MHKQITKFQFQEILSNTNYNQTITSSNFRSYHNEGDDQSVLSYITSADHSNGISFQNLSEDSRTADTDQSLNEKFAYFWSK